MQRIKGIIGNYTCSSCNSSHSFSEKFPTENVRRFSCEHFTLVVMIMRAKGLKVQIKTLCNKCFKEYSSELKLGCYDGNNNLITSDIYNSFCCQNKIEVFLSLSEEYMDLNENNPINPILNMNNRNNNISNNLNNNTFNNNNFNNFNNKHFNNFNNNQMMFNMNMNSIMNNFMNNMNQLNQMSFMNNNMMMNNMFNSNMNNMKFNMNNNNMINNMNNNMNKLDNIVNFDSSNIIEFGKKKQLVNFLDESTNKRYKIYTSPQLKVKNVLNDLLNQFPEISYNGNRLEENGRNINPELYINNCKLNENSVIIIKK